MRRSVSLSRHRHRRIAVISAVAAAAALLGACAGGNSTTTSEGGDSASSTVTVAYNTDIESWNPYAQTSTPSYSRWSNIFEPLITWDDKTRRYLPVLATSWSVKGTVWTFKLRHGVKFQSGNPFTSADVVHTFDRIMHDADSLQAPNLAEISAIKAVDDFTVQMVTKNPDAVLPAQLVNTFISSKTSYDKWGKAQADHHPDGTGPYSFVSWSPGSSLVLKKNPNYWNKSAEPSGMPENLIFKLITSPEDAVAALQRGEIDLDTNVPIQDKSTITGAGAKFESLRGDRTMFLAFNNTQPPYNSKTVRQAISYAVNVKGIIDTVLKGAMTQMHGPVPSIVYGSDPKLKPYPYDPAKAKQMLKQAGAEGDKITLTTTTNRYPADTEVAQAVAQQLHAVGLNVTVSTPDFGTFSSDLTAGKLGFYQISRGSYVDASIILSQYFQTGVTKRTQYSNPTVDRLLIASNGELNAAKRLDDLHQAEKIILADAPAVFFGAYNDLYGVSSRVTWQPPVNELIQGIDMSVK